MQKDLTIIIPFYNGHEYIDNLLKSIPDNIPTIIIDDLSDVPLQTNKDNTTIHRLTKKGYFTGAVNKGIELCNTDVLILNQDVILSDGWQENIIPGYDMIGERITGDHPLFPHGYIHGTFMFITRKLINDIGLLNAELYPLWGSTAEYQLRASRKGYKVLPIQNVKGFKHLRHGNFGSSIKSSITPENKSKLINTPPEISVIIPCYNFGKWLPDAIYSLIGGETCLGKMPGQTFNSYEIIIVDDGSNQQTQDVIKSFVDGWNGIRAIRIDRKPVDKDGKYIGKPYALNLGINKAIGKYITVLDADDMMDSRRLNVLYNTAIENPHSVIFDDLTAFTNGEFTKHWNLPQYNFEELIHKNGMHIGIFYPKQAWVETKGYPDMPYGREDWAFNVALGIKGYCGVRVVQPYYLYRREGQNRTLENTKPNWQTRFRQQMRDMFPEIYRGERPMACCGRGAKKNQNLRSNDLMRSYSRSLAGDAYDGMVYVQYVGVRVAPFTVWGSATGQAYRVNPKTPVFLVYENDLYTEKRNLPGLLDVYEGNKHVFNLYKQPVKKEPEPINEDQIVEYHVELQTALEPTELSEDVELPLVEVDKEKLIDVMKSGSSLRLFIDNKDYTLQDLQFMYEYEKGQENPRVTLLRTLEGNINYYDGSQLA